MTRRRGVRLHANPILAWLALPWAAALWVGCELGPPSLAIIDADFETGSVGAIERVGPRHWNLLLRDDNADATLPDRYRSWWHVRLRDVTPGERIRLSIRNRGWTVYYVPVYSYDQVRWHRFDESEVRNGWWCRRSLSRCSLELSTTRFTESTVYLARFYPYTTRDLDDYLDEIAADPHVEIDTLGASEAFGLPVPLVRISDPDVEDADKHAVWIHARTHPSETAASFMVEGAIDRLLDDLATGDPEARRLAYFVVPMHNVDGVRAGNSRTDTSSRNLEMEWHVDANDVRFLDPSAPRANHLLHAAMLDLVDDGSHLGDVVALNLHASNTEPQVPPFSFPHFGADPALYDLPQRTLWHRQISLLERVRFHYSGVFAPPAEAPGGADFLAFAFPETWWWWNRGPDAVAVTVEAVYGKPTGQWVTPEHVRELGESLTLAIRDYYFAPASELEEASVPASPGSSATAVPTEIESRR